MWTITFDCKYSTFLSYLDSGVFVIEGDGPPVDIDLSILTTADAEYIVHVHHEQH